MTTEEAKAINEKLDTILHILGHGRERSDAELERVVDAGMEKIRIRDENRKKKKLEKER